jgi:hypothetical protein
VIKKRFELLFTSKSGTNGIKKDKKKKVGDFILNLQCSSPGNSEGLARNPDKSILPSLNRRKNRVFFRPSGSFEPLVDNSLEGYLLSFFYKQRYK